MKKKALIITATTILIILTLIVINKIEPVQSDQLRTIRIAETNEKVINNNCQPNIQERYIRGTSLSPFLKPEDKVLVDYNYYNCHEIQKDDLVIYDFKAQKKEIIKFVKALPNDTFQIDNEKNTLSINNEILKNAAGEIFPLHSQAKKMLQLYEKSLNGKLTEDLYLIFGNHPDTTDSTKFGPVKKENIIGKVIFEN